MTTARRMQFARVGVDDEGSLRVDEGTFSKPEPWANQLTGWLSQLLATNLELFQLRVSELAAKQFAVAAVKERTESGTSIRVGTGRAHDAVAAVTKAITSAVCEDGDVLDAALARLTSDGVIDAAALTRRDGRIVAGGENADRLRRLLDAFDEPGLLEMRTERTEYGALRLGESGVALAIAAKDVSPRLRTWLTAVWEGIGDDEPDLANKDGL